MKAFIVTDIGIEEFCAQEVREKTGCDTTEGATVVVFETDDYLDLCRLCYTGQSVKRVLLALDSFEFSDFTSFVDEAERVVQDFSFEEWLDEDTRFKVESEKVGEQEFTSQDVGIELGDLIVNKVEEELGFTPDVSLEEPDVTFHCHVCEDKAYLGVDFGGRDLSQRDYKVYSHPTSIRGNLAYGLVEMSGYERGDSFLDPFCGSAPIPLEAVYHASKVPVHMNDREFAFTDLHPLKEEDWDDWFKEINKDSSMEGLDIHAFDENLQSLKYGKDNARVAGLEDFINFSKVGVEWLDTKLDEDEVDVIVTQPPQLSKSREKEDAKDAYEELFYQADYVLKDDGCVVALLLYKDYFLECAEKHGFELVEEKDIKTGDLEYVAVKVKAKT